MVVSLCLASLVLASCNTLPQGWEQATPDGIGQASILLRSILDDRSDVDLEVKLCLASCGAVAGIDFWVTRNSNDKLDKRLLHAVKSADEHAKKYYVGLYNQYKGLPGIIAYALLQVADDKKPIVELNESQLLISLLHTVVNNGMLGELLNFNTKDCEDITLPLEDNTAPTVPAVPVTTEK